MRKRELTSSSTPSPWPRIVVCHSCTSTYQLGLNPGLGELTCAISGTRGSSGLGSVNIEQIDSSTIISLVRDARDEELTLRDGQSGRPLIS
jgi:hypothetical protein